MPITTCTISGYMYDAQGEIIKHGRLTVRLQQDIISADGVKVAPVPIVIALGALDAPDGLDVANIGTAGSSTYAYEVSAIDNNGGESPLSDVALTSTSHAALNGSNYNAITWNAVPGAAGYNVYGRSSAAASRTLLATTISNSYNDQGQTPVGSARPSVNTSGGFIEVDLVPTEGATPAKVAYRVEYDPDPRDTSKPARSKDGYWQNYWAVPNSVSQPLGNFDSALRGEPSNNYMPLGGTVSSFADNIDLGSGSDTTKSVTAKQASNNPKLRYHVTGPGTGKWQISNDGTTFRDISTFDPIGDPGVLLAGSGLTVTDNGDGTFTLDVSGVNHLNLDPAAGILWTQMESAQIPATKIPVDGSTIIQSGGTIQAVFPTLANVPAGAILPYGGASAPAGFLMCDGASVLRATYAALYAVIGTTYGSADGTHFNVPNLRQRFPLGKAASGTGSTLGASGGAIDHTHIYEDVINHKHTVVVHDPGHAHGGVPTSGSDGVIGSDYDLVTGIGSSNAATTGITATLGDPIYVRGIADQNGVPNAATEAANPPFLVVNFIIKT